MSIAVLSQVYGECRRLAAAGSGVARGDFRLKKLLPPLDAAGAKAPVFARVAEAARAVTDGPEDAAAGGLLELTALVTAVLYTQGDTAVPGEPVPIPSAGLGGAANVSARLLKPLLEALTSTGSGRLELVKEGHQQGAFADLRLVGPAVAGLDDPYADVADFLAAEVLPGYGPAVVPLVRAGFNPQGGKGHPRRLKLLHRLDPAGSRELVLAGLDGSKEVRVAAVSCLGADDLSTLLTQAAAKNQEVRGAALAALARLDHPEALAAVAKGLAGKDYNAAAWAAHYGCPEAARVLASALVAGVDALDPKAGKKELGERLERLLTLVRAAREVPAAEPALFALLGRRAALMRLKADGCSGADLVDAVVTAVCYGSDAGKQALIEVRDDLAPYPLYLTACEARQLLTPAGFYAAFAPFLADAKSPAAGSFSRQAAVVKAFGASEDESWWMYAPDPVPDADPRWQDAAAKHKLVSLLAAVGRPGHRSTEKLLTAEFARPTGGKGWQNPRLGTAAAMCRLHHPDAVTRLIELVGGMADGRSFEFGLIDFLPDLPKSALPALEAATPGLKDDTVRGRWVAAVERLRDKPA